MKKILVVDDESSIRKLLRLSLESDQYQVLDADSAFAGIQAVLHHKPDLIILDLGLPDKSGFEVIQSIREWSQTPIIVLTVMDADEDKIKALDGGADDYLTKPFSVPELLVRVRVALRHANPKTSESPIFRSGPLEIDLEGHIVKVQGQIVKLTSTEFDIVKVLAKYKGKVVTHRILLNEVWGPNSVEHTHYLRVYLGAIRKKLKLNDAIPELISTEAGVGYRLLDLD